MDLSFTSMANVIQLFVFAFLIVVLAVYVVPIMCSFGEMPCTIVWLILIGLSLYFIASVVLFFMKKEK